MACPRCGNEEFTPDGICPACNYKAGRLKSVKPDGGKIVTVDQKREENPDELPPWRIELTKRLEALKQEKNPGGKKAPAKVEPVKPAPRIVQEEATVKPQTPPHEDTDSVRKEPEPPAHQESSPKAPAVAPQQKTIASLGEKVFQPPKPDKSKDIRDLIDRAVARQATQTTIDSAIYSTETLIKQENKYILLSRTLSGLIDLIIIVLCTTAFIIAADSFSGIVMLDGISVIEYTVLFLMIFFLYSIFFLSASGQTVGMMITDLQIVGIANSRPSTSQLFARCFGYLLSVIALGIGLFWSFFDRKNRCLHDRLSDTSIRRL